VNLNGVRPTFSAEICNPGTVISGSVRFMWISTRFPLKGDV